MGDSLVVKETWIMPIPFPHGFRNLAMYMYLNGVRNG
ncbi:unnamed protein product [Mycetohabitans rhizoxinica HKI 454]|uniref:Uncharacterized protein n=1 Tax=Mycetohabitans rhizoxinica (strain DSM 19002 / CIP 109453 / HKI 454) TaxID=882378 RepID=E5APB3_MYCRK|nr:unnamed protein product [Mycetohabitans rhizoxinica HKI 454]